MTIRRFLPPRIATTTTPTTTTTISAWCVSVVPSTPLWSKKLQAGVLVFKETGSVSEGVQIHFPGPAVGGTEERRAPPVTRNPACGGVNVIGGDLFLTYYRYKPTISPRFEEVLWNWSSRLIF